LTRAEIVAAAPFALALAELPFNGAAVNRVMTSFAGAGFVGNGADGAGIAGNWAAAGFCVELFATG
jgi:hypothetical protein